MDRLTILIALFTSLATSVAPAAPAPSSPVAPVLSFASPREITNPYLPWVALKQEVFEGKEGAVKLRVERAARPNLRKSLRFADQTVEPFVVQSRRYADGKLAQVTTEYLAQAGDGAVYALGADVDEYVEDAVAGHTGAWLLAEEARSPREVMPTRPKLGDRLTAADAPPIPRQPDAVVSLSETVTVPAGTYPNCLKIMATLPGGQVTYRYYAWGVGLVKETWEGGELLLTARTKAVASQPGGAQPNGKPVADPLARVALRSVGADARANEYWLGAINNPSLSGHERQDLIEDLNEEGFSDPKHPTAQDLPLILSRIRLIESLAPRAMDKVNADAFREAYKDLTTMARSLTGRTGQK